MKLFLSKVLNGPPDAVKIILLISKLFSPVRHCHIALCSLSTGKIFTPFSSAILVTSSPAITKLSLFARAKNFVPLSITFRVGFKPDIPTIAFKDKSTFRDLIKSKELFNPHIISVLVSLISINLLYESSQLIHANLGLVLIICL